MYTYLAKTKTGKEIVVQSDHSLDGYIGDNSPSVSISTNQGNVELVKRMEIELAVPVSARKTNS